MRLFLTEKPSQARSYVEALRSMGLSFSNREGYYLDEKKGVGITYCVGHLLELKDAEEYNPEYKNWTLESLPIIPKEFEYKKAKGKSKQITIIKGLVKKSKEVIIATDADREGELIARSLLDFLGYKGKLSRVWTGALDEKTLSKAIKNLFPATKTEGLYHSAKIRQQADWSYGINLTRRETLRQQQGKTKMEIKRQGVYSVGRVQTPTLAIIVEREREITNFVPKKYYLLKGMFANVLFDHLPDPKIFDAKEKKCLDRSKLEAIKQKIEGKNGVVTEVKTERKRENPPLTFSLSSLQKEASQKHGLGAEEVLKGCQGLYEKKLTSYPRTDCQYINEEQFSDRKEVIAAILKNNPSEELKNLQLNTDQKSKVWNDKKITAHHAIIPTSRAIEGDKLSTAETTLYDMISRRYLSQFAPLYEYDETIIKIEIEEEHFQSKKKFVVEKGWQQIEPLKQEKKETEEIEIKLSKGDNVQNQEVQLKEAKTQPKKRFKEGTLIGAMQNIAAYLHENENNKEEIEKYKKILKGIEGIGTEATRSGIIQTLYERKYIVKDAKGNISPTEKGLSLIDKLPPVVTNYALTAIWEEALLAIEKGEVLPVAFLDKIKTMITKLCKASV